MELLCLFESNCSLLPNRLGISLFFFLILAKPIKIKEEQFPPKPFNPIQVEIEEPIPQEKNKE